MIRDSNSFGSLYSTKWKNKSAARCLKELNVYGKILAEDLLKISNNYSSIEFLILLKVYLSLRL